MKFTSDDIFLLLMLSKEEDYKLVLDENKIIPKIKEIGDLYLDKDSYNFEDTTDDLANKLTISHVSDADYEFVDNMQSLNFPQRVDGLLLYPLVKLFYDLKNPVDIGDKYIFKPLSDKLIYEFIEECNSSGILNQELDDDDMDYILDEDMINEDILDKDMTYLN